MASNLWVQRVIVGGWIVFLTGCATAPSADTAAGNREPTVESQTALPEKDQGPLARDRSAILGLAGVFDVDYRYEEVVALREGYTPALPQKARAREVVLVAEDTPDRIVLQHLLLIGDPALIVKHWRQDWRHAPSTALQYVDDQIWRRAPFPQAGSEGVWVRSVFEADGAPTYSNWGRWSHPAEPADPATAEASPVVGSEPAAPEDDVEEAEVRWSSLTPVLAPLPRRESARRGDYEVMWVGDEITLTPSGWSQQQSLTKSVFVPTVPPLVRESGSVTYRRLEQDSAATAEVYWQNVGPYWAVTREAWAEVFRSRRDVKIFDQVNGAPRWRSVFAVVEAAASAGQPVEEIRQALDPVFREFVERR